MSLVTNIAALAQRIRDEFNAHKVIQGVLSGLNTTNKTSLVNAINEVLASVGVSINDLTTNITTTWSSSKINDTITSAITANLSNDYETDKNSTTKYLSVNETTENFAPKRWSYVVLSELEADTIALDIKNTLTHYIVERTGVQLNLNLNYTGLDTATIGDKIKITNQGSINILLFTTYPFVMNNSGNGIFSIKPRETVEVTYIGNNQFITDIQRYSKNIINSADYTVWGGFNQNGSIIVMTNVNNPQYLIGNTSLDGALAIKPGFNVTVISLNSAFNFALTDSSPAIGKSATNIPTNTPATLTWLGDRWLIEYDSEPTTPTLQEVLAEGSTSELGITLSTLNTNMYLTNQYLFINEASTAYFTFIDKYKVQIGLGSNFVELNSNGLLINNSVDGKVVSLIGNTNQPVGTVTLQTPVKPTGTYTIATIEDIAANQTTPTLQQVLAEGNTSDLGITLSALDNNLYLTNEYLFINDNSTQRAAFINKTTVQVFSNTHHTELNVEGLVINNKAVGKEMLLKVNPNQPAGAVTLQSPEKAQGTYTIATTEDLGIKQNIITVAKSGGDFTSIQSAVDASTSDTTILIYPGVYEGKVNTVGKNIRLIGVDKDSVIIQTNTGDYYDPPLECAGGTYCANITFEATSDNPNVHTINGYAVHMDFYGEGVTEFFNCKMISHQNAAMGIGLQHNQTLKINSCELIKLSDGAIYDGGSLFFHNSPYPNHSGQVLEVYNSIITTDRYMAVIVHDARLNAGGVDIDTKMYFANNTVHSDTLGLDCVSMGNPPSGGVNDVCGGIALDIKSFGNNNDELNYIKVSGYVPIIGDTTIQGGLVLSSSFAYGGGFNVSNTDFNSLVGAGFYYGSAMLNAPANEFFHIEVKKWVENSDWVEQIATSFGAISTPNITWSRVFTLGTTWTPWVKTIKAVAVNEYVDDAAADADTALNSGEYYKLTGSRAVYQKP
jgi:hypothetical protein